MSDIIVNSFKQVQELEAPGEKIRGLKNKLHDDFREKAKLPGLVSYIYYPSQKWTLFGHSELQVEGDSWNLFFCAKGPKSKPLSKIIQTAQNRFMGSPFFRFPLRVTPNQLTALRENIKGSWSFICSRGVCHQLRKYCDYSVPFLLSFSPFALAAHLFNSEHVDVRQIEFYQGPNRDTNTYRCILGISCEILLIAAITGSLTMLAYRMSKLFLSHFSKNFIN